MKRLAILVAALSTVLASPAFALTLTFDSCADVDQVTAQNALDSPIYQSYGDETLANLDPDADGIACNNAGNLAGGGYQGYPTGATDYQYTSAYQYGI